MHQQRILEEERSKNRTGEQDLKRQGRRHLNNPKREEYGEIDRPEPAEVIADIKDKFVDWDLFKISVMQNLVGKKKMKQGIF